MAAPCISSSLLHHVLLPTSTSCLLPHCVFFRLTQPKSTSLASEVPETAFTTVMSHARSSSRSPERSNIQRPGSAAGDGYLSNRSSLDSGRSGRSITSIVSPVRFSKKLQLIHTSELCSTRMRERAAAVLLSNLDHPPPSVHRGTIPLPKQSLTSPTK